MSEVPDVRFVGNGRTVTEAEGAISVCVVSGQLAEEIIPVNVTISTESGRAKGKSNKSHGVGGIFLPINPSTQSFNVNDHLPKRDITIT